MRHVVFRIGSERYGLPLASVREVVEPAPMSRVPCAPEPVLGIMNLRGRVVTVASLGALMGIEPAPPVGEAAPPGKVVILDRGRRDLGLLVGEVEGVHTIGDIAAAPGEVFPAVRGVGRPQAGGAVTVLEPEGLDRQIVALFKAR
ncbi:MAG: chemotaxis protein CheW [Myxococcales bacterium]|jgi:purine-binding chemotaxis protein CheW